MKNMHGLFMVLALVCMPLSAWPSGIGEKVVGGELVPADELPQYAHYVELRSSGRFICGGSLVSPTLVLTARHCVQTPLYDLMEDFLGVGLGLSYLSVVTSDGVERWPLYVFYTTAGWHDAAVLRLPEPVEGIEPLWLNEAHADPAAGTVLELHGKGMLSARGDMPEGLMRAWLPVVGNAKCKSQFGGLAIGDVEDTELCAGGSGTNACAGDSGGPLWDPETRVQYGIVSWGSRDCLRGPTVFARVSDYLWLVDYAAAF